MSRRSVAALLTAGVVLAVVATGCADAAPADGPVRRPTLVAAPTGPVTVHAADASCQVSVPHAAAGRITFAITNGGSRVAGFVLYGIGDQVVGEADDIGPGQDRQLVVEVPDGGIYTTACRPGSDGDGIRAPFMVTAPGGAGRGLTGAVPAYLRYAVAQVDGLAAETAQFTDDVKAGNVDAAKAAFPVAHAHYERVEPLAEKFGHLDPVLDGREDDARDPGVTWTGFHRLEKDLWVDGLQPDSGQVADRLVTDVMRLRAWVVALQLSPGDLAEGAKSLLDELGTRKITGEEDRYSGTDLWDMQANVEGARVAVVALRPAIDSRDATLGPLLDARFTAFTTLLDDYRSGDGFRRYTTLTQADIKRLTDALDALSEPVSQVAAVVTA